MVTEFFRGAPVSPIFSLVSNCLSRSQNSSDSHRALTFLIINFNLILIN